jgi:hypothetical protein
MASRVRTLATAALTFGLSVFFTTTASAHCDTMDGPVVKAAERALMTGIVTPVLIWVQPTAEEEVRDAFARTLQVRSLSTAARELADQYFYETIVRLHRAGEGEPFDGIKPSGYDVGPVIPMADLALESGSLDALTQMLSSDLNTALRTYFDRTLAARTATKEGDVTSGRAYVKAYVEFMHYVEQLHDRITSDEELHEAEAHEIR